MGKEASLADDLTFCPRCKGQFPIQPDGVGAKHAGRSYAYHDDLAACGAHLISSLTHTGKNSSSVVGAMPSKNIDQEPEIFDDRFLLIDDATGKPLALIEYAIARESGKIEYGKTDNRGETHLLSAVAASESVHIFIDPSV
ncbi:hypothetical protein [Massilia sp. S19_KUP03_FR1]|uniref:PAAR domain-containing protein n=1 Tax=Massilia sp. S19_KUP03_FR1 TaxID=3025503 RepID=UPI003FA5D1E4